MTTDLLGKAGPHPDLLDLIATNLTQTGRNVAITRDHLEFLQQRTFNDLPHPNQQAHKGGRTAISSCLAILHLPAAAQDYLVLYEAAQDESRDGWFIVSGTTELMGNPPLKPFVGVGYIMPKTALDIGLFVAHPQVAALRVQFADGTVVEDMLSNKSLHLLVPFRTPAAWAKDAMVQVLDRAGKEIVSQSAYVNPKPPSGIGPRGLPGLTPQHL